MFQFLIGTVLRYQGRMESKISDMFQFLIGTVLPMLHSKTMFFPTDVSTPYRYGITTVFSPFSGTVFFFRLKTLQKVCRPHFFIIANFLEKSSFFQKIFFRLGRQTFLHFFKIFIAFSFVFSYSDCRFSQYFQGFQGRQTF